MTHEAPTAALLGSNARYLVAFRGHLMQAIVGRGYRVLAMAPDWDPETARQVKAFGGIPTVVSLRPTGTNALHDLGDALRLAALFRRERVTLSYCYSAKCVIFGSLAAALARVRRRAALIAGLGAPFGSLSRTRWSLRISTFIARALYFVSVRLNHIVYFQNSDDLEHFVSKRYVRRANVALVDGSGIDLRIWAFHDAPLNPVRFVCITRLLEDKGVRDFVSAAQLVRQRYPSARFRLVGGTDGNPHAISENQVRAWHDAGIVEWVGHVADVRPYLISSSVFVLPSYYREGLPRSSLEAMAIGRPIITTTEPGCRETVSLLDPNGVLVESKNPPKLAEAMERFLADPGLIPVMSRASRRLAEQRFGVERVNAQIMSSLFEPDAST